MKTKNLIGLSIILSTLITSFSIAGEISLSPSNQSYAPGCIIGIDINVDPKGKMISATDLVIESSMEFLAFKEGNTFPYFLPPKKNGNITHIVGFTTNPNNHIYEKGKIGTVYYKTKNDTDSDGSIKFYIKEKGSTIDTNLSTKLGLDVLERAQDGIYSFKGNNCPTIDLDLQDTHGSYEDELKNTISNIKNDELKQKTKIFIKKYKYIMASLILIVILSIIIFKNKKINAYVSKNILMKK